MSSQEGLRSSKRPGPVGLLQMQDRHVVLGREGLDLTAGRGACPLPLIPGVKIESRLATELLLKRADRMLLF